MVTAGSSSPVGKRGGFEVIMIDGVPQWRVNRVVNRVGAPSMETRVVSETKAKRVITSEHIALVDDF